MREASTVLADARTRAANNDMEGAIRLLRDELNRFTGDLDDRRAMVALLLTYCGRREKLSEGIQIAEQHFRDDPASIIDASLKARLVMNYAALKAASGNVSEAITILGDILLCSGSAGVSEEDKARVSTMLESLRIEGDSLTSNRGGLTKAPGGRSEAYLASALISRLINSGSFPEAVSLARASLEKNVDLEDGPLKIALMLDLGVGLVAKGETDEAGEWLRKSYQIATRSVMRSGTLFALVAKSYAVWLDDAGQVHRSVEILEDLLEAQLLRFGDANTEVMATKAMLAKIRSARLLGR